MNVPPGGLIIPRLAEPTGPHSVGQVADRYFVDRTRPDPWSPEQPFRELMLSFWYPANRSAAPRARYLPAREGAEFDKWMPPYAGIPAGTVAWAETVVHAKADAAPVDSEAEFPVVLLETHYTGSRAQNTALAEELTSHGYIVVAVDHTYEADVVEFPGGRLERSRITETDLRACLDIRVRDLRFVLDELHRQRDAGTDHLTASMDLSRLAVLGHSLGGASAAQLITEDKRVAAGVNMDGRLWGAAAVTELKRPFLLLSKPENNDEVSNEWRGFAKRQQGWFRWLSLEGAAHDTFNDLLTQLSQCDAVLGLPQDKLRANIGTIDPARGNAVLRRLLTTFVDCHLKPEPGRFGEVARSIDELTSIA